MVVQPEFLPDCRKAGMLPIERHCPPDGINQLEQFPSVQPTRSELWHLAKLVVAARDRYLWEVVERELPKGYPKEKVQSQTVGEVEGEQVGLAPLVEWLEQGAKLIP